MPKYPVNRGFWVRFKASHSWALDQTMNEFPEFMTGSLWHRKKSSCMIKDVPLLLQVCTEGQDFQTFFKKSRVKHLEKSWISDALHFLKIRFSFKYLKLGTRKSRHPIFFLWSVYLT